jgi:DnaK suppressor protein
MRQLTSSDLNELEDELRRERATVLEAIRIRLVGRDDDEQRVLINYFADGDSRAATEQLNENELALLRHELTELGAIDSALKRIDFGTGGLCVVCGNPIPLPRLRAAPAAQTCLECQVRKEAQGGSGPHAHG